MRISWTLVVTLLAHKSALGAAPTKRSYDTHNYYVVEHDPRINSGASLADAARALGVEVVEQAGELHNHWLVRTQKPTGDLVARGEGQREVDPVIETFDRLRSRASSALAARSEEDLQARAVVSSVRYLSRQVLSQRVRRAPPPIRPPQSQDSVVERFGIKDPLFPQQWHLVNDEHPEHMMNVAPVWEMGFTGKGIISSVVDDGLDYTSVDLADNFVRLLTLN